MIPVEILPDLVDFVEFPRLFLLRSYEFDEMYLKSIFVWFDCIIDLVSIITPFLFLNPNKRVGTTDYERPLHTTCSCMHANTAERGRNQLEEAI